MSSCVLLKYLVAIIVTIFVRFPTEIGCCSMTTYDIITIMSQNPNYESDPCYIQWKAAQDEQLSKLWSQRDELEKNGHEQNRRRLENEAIERANRQKSYSYNVSQSKRKESSIWKVLGALIGAIVGFCCCIACVTAACDNDEPTIATATDVPQSVLPQMQSTMLVSSNPLENRNTLNADDNFSNITASPPYASVPLMMPKRQNSLPSYEDAVRMATAPTTME